MALRARYTMVMSGTVGVVIVTFNGRGLLAICLAALFEGTREPDEVVVVDNGSTDGTLDFIGRTYPSIACIPSTVNLGFAAANNRGIAATQADYILTLNNDAFLDANALAEMARTLDEAPPSIGAVMSAMVFADRPEIIACSGIDVSADGAARDRGVGTLWERAGTSQEIFGPSAGAALYRRAALRDVGLFDPAFFMYLEDADLAWRLRLRGWGTLLVPRARVRHAISRTAVYGSARKAFLLGRNRWWCLLKNMPDDLLRRFAPNIARYDAAAVGYATALGDRASLAGRRQAWSEMPHILRARARTQAWSTVRSAEIASWIRAAPPLSDTLKERRLFARLVRDAGR